MPSPAHTHGQPRSPYSPPHTSQNGEKLSEEELARCLAALVVADGDAESTLPATMTAAVFAGDVLGFDAA